MDLFRERNAIDQTQYDKSLGELRDKMGMYDVTDIKARRAALLFLFAMKGVVFHYSFAIFDILSEE